MIVFVVLIMLEAILSKLQGTGWRCLFYHTSEASCVGRAFGRSVGRPHKTAVKAFAGTQIQKEILAPSHRLTSFARAPNHFLEENADNIFKSLLHLRSILQKGIIAPKLCDISM